MAFRAVAAASVTASAIASKQTFEDCGDASTIGTIKDVHDLDVIATLSEDFTAGDFTFTATAAGATLFSTDGDVCAPKTVNLPLGAGTFAYKGNSCPMPAGDVEMNFEVTFSAAVPPPLAKADIQINSKTADGKKALCAVVHRAPAALSWDAIVDHVNAAKAKWVAAVPPKFASPEDVHAHLGALLPGDEQYEEPEVLKLQAITVVVPDEFDSATNWPDCPIIAHVEDQSACGTCWAFASTESFQDRACIATGKSVQYSTSDTAFCSTAGFGCNGGNSAWDWFTSVGVVTGGDHGGDGCKPYDFAPCAHHVPATEKYPACPSGEYPSPQCTRECEAGYPVSYANDKVMAASAYSVRGVDRIMADLVQHGPLYVAFTVYSDFPTYKSGVYHHVSGSMLGGHAVELVGFGAEDGTAYWKIKNSWNEQWGDHGHFKIVRGTNECGIESSVSAGTIAAVATV